MKKKDWKRIARETQEDYDVLANVVDELKGQAMRLKKERMDLLHQLAQLEDAVRQVERAYRLYEADWKQRRLNLIAVGDTARFKANLKSDDVETYRRALTMLSETILHIAGKRAN